MKGLIRVLFCAALAASALAFFDRDSISSARRRLQTLTESPEDPANNFQSMKVPTSIYEISSPVDYAYQTPGAQANPAGILNVSPMDHDRNYLRIADDMKRYEDAYAQCINHLSDNDFSDETVDNCVGINYNYVYDDLDYEKSKILARADSALRDFMIQHCYTVAGVDLVLSNACDLVEQDATNLLWNELNFAALIDYHRNKYLFEHSFMSETVFDSLIGQFKIIGNETSSLLGELYDHRKLTVTHIEDLISRRTAEIMEKYQGSAEPYQSTPQFVTIQMDEFGDDFKKQRSLNNNFQPPKARFLELNTKNLQKVADKKTKETATAAAANGKGSLGKILVDSKNQVKKGTD